jgi:hypothetical protein
MSLLCIQTPDTPRLVFNEHEKCTDLLSLLAIIGCRATCIPKDAVCYFCLFVLRWWFLLLLFYAIPPVSFDISIFPS